MSPFDADSPSIKRDSMPKNPSKLRGVISHELEPVDTAQNENTEMTRFPSSDEEYAAYADAVADATDLDIFEEDGLLARLYTISRTRLSYLEDSGSNEVLIKDAQLECRSWDLIQRLYLERTKDVVVQPHVSRHASNHLIVQNLYDTNNKAAESKIVLDWLHDGSSEEADFSIKENRWFYTKEAIKSRKRGNLGNQDQKVVDSLDPDAPTRQGKKLAEEDSEYERNLVRAMYKCVRAGQYIPAAELARHSGEFWRAASLQGCVEHSNMQMDDNIAGSDVQSEGCVQKPLWRRMCYALSQQNSFDKYERALYGALCGDITSVVPVLSSWEDRLWVNYNAMNQSVVERHLRSLGRAHMTQDFAMSDYAHLTPQSILESLIQSNEDAVRLEARQPLRVVQARIISDQVDVLLRDIHSQLRIVQKGGPTNIGCSPSIIRFVVHFIFVLRRLSIALPEEVANVIIQAYVEILTIANQADAIALYASHLPPSESVEALARYFMLVEEEDVRRAQLEIGAQYGIDMRITILRSVELVFEKILSEFILGQGVRNVNSAVDREEEKCIRALEWLNLNESLQLEAVMLGNNLFRKLLLAGRTSAAKTLAMRMPDTKLVPIGLVLDDNLDRQNDLPDTQMRDAIEYVGYCTLVKALAKYEDWKTLIRGRPQEINGRRDPVGLRQWNSDIARLRSECLVVMKEILTCNWCDAIELGVTDQVVIDEMFNLRNMYVPDIVLKMHGVLAAHEGRDVAAVMDLAVQVSENLTLPMKQSGLLSTYVSELALLGAYLV